MGFAASQLMEPGSPLGGWMLCRHEAHPALRQNPSDEAGCAAEVQKLLDLAFVSDAEGRMLSVA
jgi:hypothetical protein